MVSANSKRPFSAVCRRSPMSLVRTDVATLLALSLKTQLNPASIVVRRAGQVPLRRRGAVDDGARQIAPRMRPGDTALSIERGREREDAPERRCARVT